jgi:hypothetical protein
VTKIKSFSHHFLHSGRRTQFRPWMLVYCVVVKLLVELLVLSCFSFIQLRKAIAERAVQYAVPPPRELHVAATSAALAKHLSDLDGQLIGYTDIYVL